MEVKNNHAYVTTQRILNKFIEINFSMRLSIPRLTTSKNIDEILRQKKKCLNDDVTFLRSYYFWKGLWIFLDDYQSDDRAKSYLKHTQKKIAIFCIVTIYVLLYFAQFRNISQTLPEKYP